MHLVKLFLISSLTLLTNSCFYGASTLNRTGNSNVYCQRVEKYLNLLAQPGLTPEQKARYRMELHDNTKYCDEFGNTDKKNREQEYIKKKQNSNSNFNSYKPKVF